MLLFFRLSVGLGWARFLSFLVSRLFSQPVQRDAKGWGLFRCLPCRGAKDRKEETRMQEEARGSKRKRKEVVFKCWWNWPDKLWSGLFKYSPKDWSEHLRRAKIILDGLPGEIRVSPPPKRRDACMLIMFPANLLLLWVRLLSRNRCTFVREVSKFVLYKMKSRDKNLADIKNHAASFKHMLII